MAITTVQIDGSDGTTHNVIGDLDGTRFTPIYIGYGIDDSNEYRPLKVSNQGSLIVEGQDGRLRDILEQLQILNTYFAMMMGEEITRDDIR